jgi:hypothetical protein
MRLFLKTNKRLQVFGQRFVESDAEYVLSAGLNMLKFKFRFKLNFKLRFKL